MSEKEQVLNVFEGKELVNTVPREGKAMQSSWNMLLSSVLLF